MLLSIATTSIAAEEIEDAVSAPDSYQSQLVLEEVIVTARRREEELQDTPVAISAFSAEDLKVQGIANTRDLQLSVPGLNFSEMGNKAPSIFIRGVGQKEAIVGTGPRCRRLHQLHLHRAHRQPVAGRHRHGIHTGVARAAGHPVRQEQHRRRAAGHHAIARHRRATRVKCPPAWAITVARDLKVSGNIPLIDDKLAARVSLNSTNLDGYLESTYNGEHYGDEDRLGATARVVWQATDTFNADLFYYWSKIDENGAGFTCVYQNPNGVFNTFTWPGFTAPNSYQSRCNVSEAEADDNKVLLNGPTKFEMTSQILGADPGLGIRQFRHQEHHRLEQPGRYQCGR